MGFRLRREGHWVGFRENESDGILEGYWVVGLWNCGYVGLW
jgi:hypothetical protein